MTTIKLQRNKPKGKAVTGVITLPFETPLTYPTLENADFIIPAGSYPLDRTWSPRFKKLLPIVENVPEREGIRIHLGTKPEHSQGCILVQPECLANINVLFNRIEKFNDLYEKNESITIDITETE
jgi:hypothetical protein